MQSSDPIKNRGLFNVDLSGAVLADTGSAMTRREVALARAGDILDWHRNEQPETPGMYDVYVEPVPGKMGDAKVRRVLYSGALWVSSAPVAGWRNSEATFPGPATANLATTSTKLSAMDTWSLAPMEDGPKSFESERRAVLELAARERGIDINVTRIFKPGDTANGIVSGKVLAVSENYAAQSVGDNDIMLHEQARLDRRVQPGEHVTFDYKNGQAKVYNGCLFDVDIKADTLDRDQQSYLRRKLLEVFANFDRAPANDAMVVEATKWALGETVKAFGLADAAVKVASLSVQDTFRKPAAPSAGATVPVKSLAEIREQQEQAANAMKTPMDPAVVVAPEPNAHRTYRA